MALRAVLIATLLVGLASCFQEYEYKVSFADWMHVHEKMYTASEFAQRFQNFRNTMDYIEKTNADPSNTYTVGLNKFSDLSPEEFASIYLGSRFDATERLANAGEFVNYTFADADNINWAARGAVTPPKDQGSCGSCWSFSTTGSVEGLNQIYTGSLISLSEQNLMDCSGGYGNQGCNGGWMDSAFKYIIANNGIEREANYPYEGKVGSCRFNAAYTGASMRSFQDVQAGNEGALQNANNVQPVSVAIDASKLQSYKSGIFNPAGCSTTSLDHGVLVVGYGNEGGDYWIIKNSWGLNWGNGGYFWMARNAGNMCGVASAASVPRP